jgi:putative copper resistance protein D
LEDRLIDTLIAVRVLHFAATVTLVGAVVFQFHVAAPLLGSASDAAGGQRIAHFTGWIWWIGLALAVASGAAWLVVLTAQITGDTITAAFPDAAILLTQTQFGNVAGLRFAIALLLAAALQWHQLLGGLRWLALGLALCFAGTLAWSGHSGAGDGPAGDVQVAADALHLIAASAWVGGLIPLTCLFVLASQPASGLSPDQIADVTHRFSTTGIVSVATLLITGIINTWFLVGSIAILLGSSYGQLLMIKLALFLIMVGIAAINRTRLTPMLTASANDRQAKATRHLARNSLIEASLGLAILAIVGALGTLPPELPDEHHMHSHAH